MRKKILILCTGGTIASKKTEDGLAPKIPAEEMLSYVPEAAEVCDMDVVQVCNIDSTNMTPAYWRLLAETIETHYDSYDGFVVLHGTDTMAYTSAALSYMIQRSPKPIVITGAQKPIDMDTTDAKTNLLDSIIYAADDRSQDVVIVFDGMVIAGTRAKKVRAKSYNAFSSVNFPELAVMLDGKIVRYIPQRPYKERAVFHKELNENVVVLKLIPGTRPQLLGYLFENYDCIIIESFGVGGLPESLVNAFYAEMKHWLSKGKLVVMATQVVNEGSNMEVYEVGQKVKKEFNLIEAYDMTFEATVTKTMFLMQACGGNAERFREAFYQTVNFDILYTRKS
ncbi:MAG: asparaginase [Eubacteriales bacterium]|nr:asparaginase [Eubacteriales bacterium]